MWPRTAKLLALVICPCWWVTTANAELGVQTLQGTLLLHNGEVIEGTATRSGDRFTVQLRTGGQLRIPVADVEFFGYDIDQVYRHQLSRVEPDDADQFLRLSRWCLAQGMLKEAAQCVLSVSRLDPYHPELEPMERRLLEAARPRETTTDVHHALHEENHEADPPALVELPPSVVAEFSRRIQPILLNGCAAAACHRGPTEAVYQLHLPPRNWPMPRHLTLENLRSTLVWIESEDVDTSRLLEKARTPHGPGSNTRVPQLDRRQYASLRAWAGHAAVPGDESDRTIVRSNIEESSDADAVGSAHSWRQNLKREPDVAERDPFDPEFFNREFLEPEETALPITDDGRHPNRGSDWDQIIPGPEVDDAKPQEPRDTRSRPR